MKTLLIAATATSLALLVPVVSPPAPPTPKVQKETWKDKLALLLPVLSLPAAHAQDDIYWDPNLVVGSQPYALNGTNLKGQKVSLKKYKGKVLVLDFWATWCPPCVAEIPNVKANYQKYHKKGLEILGISLDRDKEPLNKFIATRQIPWAQVYDRDLEKEGNAYHYGVKAIPFVLVIGKDGKIASVNPHGDDLEPAIKAALAK